MKLSKIKNRGEYGAHYQTEPLHGTGIGRFQVWKTDNANARAIGRRGKWTVRDLFSGLSAFACLDTLAECEEWCDTQAARTAAKLAAQKAEQK